MSSLVCRTIGVAASLLGLTGCEAAVPTEGLPPVAAVVVAPGIASLTVGRTTQLAATAVSPAGQPLSGRLVKWETSAGTIATISASGLLTATGVGTATITATVEGKSGYAQLRVLPPAAEIAFVRVVPERVVLGTGESRVLSATAFDGSGQVVVVLPISWNSSTPEVASVDPAGRVTGVSVGTAMVTAQIGPARASVPVEVAAPTPQANQIAYEAPGGGDGGISIYLQNIDGTGRQVLFGRPGDGFPVYFELFPWDRLAWSPDGGQLAFTSGRGELMIANRDGSGAGMLAGQPGSTDTWTSAPAWSPDGTQIAFASLTWYWADQGTGIYLAPPRVYAGGGWPVATRLTRANDWWPTWSPDGKRIAFARFDRSYFLNPLWTMPNGTVAAGSDIFVMNADGSGVTQLTHTGWSVSGLAWSPDGSTMAFSADLGGCQAILTMESDGSKMTRLTECGENRNPSWSPDCRQIAFESGRSIYIMNADGSGATLLPGGVPGVNPAWSPRR